MESCDPCKVRAAHTKAVKYCVTCQEPQCQVCCEVHKSSKATRTHLLIDIADFNKDSRIDQDLESYQKCLKHTKETNFFCTDHNHLLCSTCLLSANKLGCKSIVDISSVGERLVSCKIDDQVKRDLNNVICQCTQEEKDIQNFIQSGKSEREHLQTFFKDVKHRITLLFDKYEKQILEKANENFEVEFTELTQHLKYCKDTLKKAEGNKAKLQTVTETGSKADVFRCILSITDQNDNLRLASSGKEATVYRHMLKLSTHASLLLQGTYPLFLCNTTRSVKEPPHYLCIVTTKEKLSKTAKDVAQGTGKDSSTAYSKSSAEADTEISEEKTDGIDVNLVSDDDKNQLNEETAKSTRVSCNQTETKIVRVSNIRILTPDNKQPTIEGVTTLYDGRLIVSDKTGSRLIALNENLTYSHELALAEAPGHLTVITSVSIAMCLPTSNRIAIISVKADMEWKRAFKTKHSPRGIYGVDRNRLFVSMADDKMTWHFNVLSPEGTVLVTIRTTDSVMDASYISSVELGNNVQHYLLCCSISGFLYSLQLNGKKTFQYKVKSPKGVYVDDAGLIYVIESTGTLHLLTTYGKLLQKVPITEGANGITFHKKMDRLVITRQNQSEITVYKVTR